MKINNLSKKFLSIIIAIMLLSAVIIPTVALAATENDEVSVTGIQNNVGENNEPAEPETPEKPATQEELKDMDEGKKEGLNKLLKIFQFTVEDKNLVIKVNGNKLDYDAGASIGLITENGELGVKVGNGAARFGKIQIFNNGEGKASINLKERKFSGEGKVNILDKFTIAGNGSISFEVDTENYELRVTAEGGATFGDFSIPANGTAAISLDTTQDRLLNKVQIRLVSANIMGHDINVDIVNKIIDTIKNIIMKILDSILGKLKMQ